jgi:G3E family GTPase
VARDPQRRVPFTILTGWLGAGKTSALNRMLAHAGGRRIAVLVNELGRIAIDTQLIVGVGGDVIELAGGCVCCKVDVRSDLWTGIADIVERSQPDHVVLETTGIAEPAAILEGLVRVAESVRERIVPAGVVCLVDAESGARALEKRDEAKEQVVSADRVLLTKLDVAEPEAVRATHALLDELAPEAERAAFPLDEAGSRALTAWVVEKRAVRVWSLPRHDHDEHGGHHHHGSQLVAVSFTDEAPLVGERVMAVIDALGDRLVRAKGFLNLAGDARRGFVERAGIRTSLTPAAEWGDAPRRTELVLIGDDLDEAAIQRALWACRTR